MGIETAYNILEDISQRYRKDELVVQDEVDEGLFQQVMAQAQKWKENHKLYENKTIKEKIVRELACYDEFARELLKNPEAMKECFKIIFTCRFPIKYMVTFFKVCAVDLKKALLVPWVGFHWKEKEVLRIEMNDAGQKDLQFFIAGRFQSIMSDDNEIEENDNHRVAWGALREKLSTYNTEIPEHVVFEDVGLWQFRSQGMQYPENGEWKKIETVGTRWWENPNLHVMKTLPQHKVEKKLGIEIVDEQPYVRTVESTFVDPLNFVPSHGSESMWVPQGDGMYRFYPIGKYASEYPNSTIKKVNYVGNAIIKFFVDYVINPIIGVIRSIDAGIKHISFFGNSVKADLTVPDPNPIYATIRKHAVSPHLLDKEQAEGRLTQLGNNAENLVFQWGNRNCAAEAQLGSNDLFGDEALDYFTKPMVKSEPNPPVNWFISYFKWFEGETRHKVMLCWVKFMGGGREYTAPDGKIYSIVKSSFTEDWRIYLPGILGKRITQGKIPGKVTFGYA